MSVTVGNTKRGVGKTALAVKRCFLQELAGCLVWLIDGVTIEGLRNK